MCAGGSPMRTGLRELYLKRLLTHALRYKWLLVLTLVAGMLNVGLTFVFPWLIGSAIDHVTAPDWERWRAAGPPTFEQRSQHLWMLVAIGAGTALMFGVINYTRGHYSVKLG